MKAPLPGQQERPGLGRRARSLGMRALRVELRIYESLGRAITRRPRVPRGDRGFHYHRPVLTVLIVFIVLSAVEIPIIDAIVHQWLPVRIAFLALGIWGLTWMLGLLCAFFTRPHVVGAEGITVREGLETELQLPWAEIASVRFLEQRSAKIAGEEKPPKVFDEEGRQVMAIRVSNETNLEIEFERPIRLLLPGLPPRGGAHECELLRFWADDPRGLLDEVRRHM